MLIKIIYIIPMKFIQAYTFKKYLAKFRKKLNEYTFA